MSLRIDHDFLLLTVNENRTYSEHRFTIKNVFSYTTGVSTPDYSFVSNRSLRRGHFPLRVRNVGSGGRVNGSESSMRKIAAFAARAKLRIL